MNPVRIAFDPGHDMDADPRCCIACEHYRASVSRCCLAIDTGSSERTWKFSEGKVTCDKYKRPAANKRMTGAGNGGQDAEPCPRGEGD